MKKWKLCTRFSKSYYSADDLISYTFYISPSIYIDRESFLDEVFRERTTPYLIISWMFWSLCVYFSTDPMKVVNK